MAEDFYTSAFEEAEKQAVPGEVRRAVNFLRAHRDVESVYRVARGTPRRGLTKVVVGARLRIGPYLPSRLDPAREGMQPVEPVIFLFDARRYPQKAPSVGSDRRDFSWDGKPHVSQPLEAWPPLFCLSRVPLDDWFAEYGFAAFVDRLFGWLIDAAQGKLQREDGRFEPTMAPAPTSCLFDYDTTASWIMGQREIARKRDFTYAQFKGLQQGKYPGVGAVGRFAVRFDAPTSPDTAKRYIAEPQKHKDEEGSAFGGFAAWTKAGTCTSETFSVLPSNRQELLDWSGELGIEVEEPLGELESAAKSAGTSSVLIPMLIGIQRPSKLFGVESDLEILPFLYCYESETERSARPVFFARHKHLHTAKRARYLSNTDKLNVPVTLVGSGALGSKLFGHWYRGGQVSWTLVDDDRLASHNLVRHGLGPREQGRAKVEGLEESVAGMFAEGVGEKPAVCSVRKSLARALEDAALRSKVQGSFVIDATASAAALQEVTGEEMPDVAGAARGFIVDEGRKAGLLLEGSGRNPRLDDARAYLYQLGMTNDRVSDWLARRDQQQDASAGLLGEEVEVGLGCASDTFRLSDDEVSLHAAQLSMRLRRWLGKHHGPAARSGTSVVPQGPDAHGKIGLSSAGEGWQEWEVPPVVVKEAAGDWQVRVAEAAVSAMARLREKHAPDETGGVALGRVNYNRRIIFLTQVLPPPDDSTCSPNRFVRGTKGVKSDLKEVSSRTGSMIGYVAEWHSHPRGPRRLSGQDFKMARCTRKQYQGSTFPAIVVVAAPSGLAVHVEEAEHE